MSTQKRFFLIIGSLSLIVIGILFLFPEKEVSGAPQEAITSPATTSVLANFSFTIGTSTSLSEFGTSTLAVYGSTTIQTRINTLHAFRVINAASTTVFVVDTVGSRASTTNLTISGINGSSQCLSINSVGTVSGSGATCGGGAGFGNSWQLVTGDTNAITPTTTVGIIVNNSTSSIYALSVTHGTTTNATSTNLNVSGQVDFDGLTSAILLTGAGGILAEYAGTSCTNQFPRSLSALGAATCETVADADVVNALTISAGTINDSTVGDTTRSTGAFTTLNTTGLFNLFGNITGTSTADFSGGVFKTTASSSLTTLTSGEIGIDTTSGQLRFYTGTQTAVIVATSSPVFNMSSSSLAYGAFGEGAGTTTIKLAGIWSAFTINHLWCVVMGTSTTNTASVRFGDGSASTSFALANQAGFLTVLSSNNSFTSYENMYVEIGSAVNSPDSVSCSVNRTYDSN